MLQSVITLVLATAVLGLPKNYNILDGKIVGGVPADIREYPHQISLQYNGKHICGASILDANTILTAAHCVIVPTPSVFSIRAGSTFHALGGQRAQVAEIYVHPKYSPRDRNDYDVAVMKLLRPISLDNISKTPIAITRKEPQAGTKVIVSGWGDLASDGVGPKDLRAVQVFIISRSQCNQQYRGGISQRMICAGLPEGGKDSCQGDSGGPLISGGVQVGVVSWGIGCADGKYPGVYTNLADPEVSSFILRYI